MALRLRLGTVLILAVTPSACTLLDGLGGLESSGGEDAGGDVVGADVSGDGLDVGTSDTWMPPVESGADAPHPESSTMDVVHDTTPPADVQDAPPLTYWQEVLADSPQAYWRLDEPVGSTVAHDITASQYHGTYVGGVTLNVPGAIAHDSDTAAQFDGNTAWVDAKNIFQFAGKVPFTLEAWVKPTLDTNYRAWLSRNDSSGPPSEGYLAYIDPGGGIFSFQRVDSGTKITAAGGTNATSGAWAYVVVVYDPNVGSIVYVNGQAGPTTTNDVSLAGATSDFTIGAQNVGGAAWFLGAIDEVAVYNYALSAARILVHYRVGTGQ
jgi:hypothetical protein